MEDPYDQIDQHLANGGTAVLDDGDPYSRIDQIVQKYPDIKPSGVLGTAGTALNRYLPTSLAVGGAGLLGGVGGAALGGPVGAIAGDTAAGIAAGYGAEKLREASMGDAAVAREQAQLEADQIANPKTSAIATMGGQIPAFLSPGSGMWKSEKEAAKLVGKEFAPTLGKSLVESAKGGARMLGASEASREVESGEDFTPSKIADAVAKGAITMGPLGFVSKIPGLAEAATSTIGKVLQTAGHAAGAAEVLSHSNALYDSVKNGQPYDEAAIQKHAVEDFPAFFALGVAPHLLGGKKAGSPEGQTIEGDEANRIFREGAVKLTTPVVEQKANEIGQAVQGAADIAPAVANKLVVMAPEILQKTGEQTHQEIMDGYEKIQKEQEKAIKESEQALKSEESTTKETPNEESAITPPFEPEGLQPKEVQEPTPVVGDTEVVEQPIKAPEKPVEASEAPEPVLTPEEGKTPVIDSQLTEETPPPKTEATPKVEKPKNAPPERRANVGLGMHGIRSVEFPHADDKVAYSLKSTFKKNSQRARVDQEKLARAVGVKTEEAWKLAKEYRDSIVNQARDVQEGDVFKAKQSFAEFVKEKKTPKIQSNEEGKEFSKGKTETDDSKESFPTTHEGINKMMDKMDAGQLQKMDRKRIQQTMAHVSSEKDSFIKNRILNQVGESGDSKAIDVFRSRRLIEDLRSERKNLEIEALGKEYSTVERGRIAKELDRVDSEFKRATQINEYIRNQWGLTGRFSQELVTEDFTSDGIERSLKAANGGKDLTPKQKEVKDDLVKRKNDVDEAIFKNTDTAFRENVDAPLREGVREAVKSAVGDLSSNPSDPEHIANVKGWLKKRGYSSNGRIKVVDGSDIVKMVGGKVDSRTPWFASYDPKTKEIAINAKNVRDEDHFHQLLNHEFVHVVGKDAEVMAQKSKLLRYLSQDEIDALEAHKKNYRATDKNLSKLEREAKTKYLQENEVIPKAVELILARPQAKSFFKAIKNAAKRMLGMELHDEDAHSLAMDILGKGEKEFQSEKFTQSGKSYAQGTPEKVPSNRRYDHEADIALLKKEMADNMGVEGGENAGVISDDALMAAMRLANHEASQSTEKGDSFSQSVFNKIKENSPEGSQVTHESVRDKMEDWMRDNVPTKEDIASKMARNRSKQSQSTDDKELERLKKEYAKLQNDLKKGNFVKTTPTQKKLSAEAQALKIKVDVLKEQKATAIIEARQKAQPGLYKVGDAIARWKRFAILTSPNSILKLADAVLTRSGTMPIEDFLGSAWAKILGKTGRAATIEGRFSPSAYAKGLSSMFTKGMADMAQTYNRGHSDLDIEHGAAYAHGGWLVYFGRLHGAIKAPLKRFSFEVAMQKQIEAHMIEHPDAPPSPLELLNFSARAYQHAQRQIFNNDSNTVDKWNEFVGKLDKGGDAGKISATILKVLMPIVKVPFNIAKEAMTYVGGVPAGLYNLGKVWKQGLKNLPEDHADMVLRQLKKGSIGGAFMLMGFLNPGIAGGYFQRGDKRKEDDAKVGQLRINGWDVPKWMSHLPLIEALHIGSTLRRVADSRDKSGESKGIGEGALAAAFGVINEIPFVNEALHLGDLESEYGRHRFLNDQAKGLVPSALEYTARQTDLDSAGQPRKVKEDTLVDSLKATIPGVRKELPTRVIK